MSDDRPPHLPQPNEPPVPSPEPGALPSREPTPPNPEPSPLPAEPAPAEPSASLLAPQPPGAGHSAMPDGLQRSADTEPPLPESPGALIPTSGQETLHSVELPPFPELPPAAPERDPFWGYSDLLLVLGLFFPSILLGFLTVKAAKYLLRLHDPNQAAEQLAMQTAAYAFLFGALMIILRLQYDRPFWRSLGWIDYRLPVLRIVISGLGAALGLAVLATLIGTPTTANPMTELLKDHF